jgi:hypothetical protein
MPHIVQRTLDGVLKESVVSFVLLRYETDNAKPGEYLAGLLKTNLTPEQRQRCERLIGILKGVWPPRVENKDATQSAASSQSGTATSMLAPSESAKVQLPKITPKSLPQTVTIPESTSSTPWYVVAVVIGAVMVLLWLLLKKRQTN